MKTLLATALIVVSTFSASQSSAAQVEISPAADPSANEVYCGAVPGKGYKCSDGGTTDEAEQLRSLNERGQTLLHITARVDVSACEVGSTKWTSCTSKRLPDTDVVIVPTYQCSSLGRLFAKAKWEELRDMGWKATIIFKCD